jgi:hypothetical protein
VLINRIEDINRSGNKLRQSQSIHLYKLLEPLSFDANWVKSHPNPTYYRRVGKNRDVLDTAGSLSDGGRYNIGGAQTSSTAVKQFGPIGRKKSALYLCEDSNLVRKEFGDEGMAGSTAVTYSISARDGGSFNLIEMDSVMAGLSSAIPNIKSLTGSPSIQGTWVDIKFPAPIQVLGHWLIHNAPERTHGTWCS